MAPFLLVMAQQQPTQQFDLQLTYHPSITAILNLIMKFTSVLVAFTATLASARPQYSATPSDPHAWMSASSDDCTYTCSVAKSWYNTDIRSPRPMPNAQHPSKSRFPSTRWPKLYPGQRGQGLEGRYQLQHVSRRTHVAASHHRQPRA